MTLFSHHQHRQRKGFSFLEIVAVLVIIGIVSAVAGLGLTGATQAYLSGRNHVENAQKAQLVMNRIVKEFFYPVNTPVITDGGNTLTFSRGTGVAIQWDGNSGGNLTLNGQLFCAGVQAFNASAQADGSTRVALTLSSATAVEYAVNLFPRN